MDELADLVRVTVDKWTLEHDIAEVAACQMAIESLTTLISDYRMLLDELEAEE